MTAQRRMALAFLCALSLGAYMQALHNRFAMDDEFVVLRNERVHQMQGFVDALSAPYWPNTASHLAMYRPVTTAALGLQWAAWQDHPFGYHAVNLGIHVGVTALVFLLLAALSSGVGPALAGAAVFAVHPVHVEAVAAVVGLGELLATAFVLLSCLVYLRAGRGVRTAVAIGALYLLALGSKEIAATLPGLLVLLEAVRPEADPGFGAEGEVVGPAAWLGRLLERWRIYLGTVVALVIYGALRISVLGTAVGSAAASFFQPLDFGERLLTAVSIWPEYLRLMLFPVHLVADYSPGVLTPVTEFDARVALGLAVGLVAVGATWVAWRRSRLVSVGILWFSVAVLPVSNLVIPIAVLLAERTLYLPSVGLALVVCGLVARAWSSRPAWRTGIAAAMILVVFLAGVRTWIRTPAWKDTSTIIGTLVRDHPESFRVQWMAANQLWSRGHTDRALDRYRTAVHLMPGHYQLQIEYGRAALQQGLIEEAIESFRVARDAVPDLPEAHVFLMLSLLQADRAAEAVAVGRTALQRLPDHRGVHHQLAIALARTGDHSAALDARRESIRLAGERASWLQLLHEAELLLRLGRHDAAAATLERAHESAPDPTAVPSLEALARAIDTADSAVLPYP